MDNVTVARPFFKEYAWQALMAWGETSQLDMAVEECAELIKAIQDYKRGRLKNPKEAILDEVVDVLLMTDQLREIFLISGEELEKRRKQKIVRLCTRMDAEETRRHEWEVTNDTKN
ncbi:hypothetical protein LCGC14_1505290 [marine sediment metagenome]|uniref:NTP pyrophosphohydrolase MazG putative catalytic core domain-containing protein n=1 Tax=marine sediment metagenome TaxID=412755 RepID=A0A0F9J2W8_9ZZZZ